MPGCRHVRYRRSCLLHQRLIWLNIKALAVAVPFSLLLLPSLRPPILHHTPSLLTRAPISALVPWDSLYEGDIFPPPKALETNTEPSEHEQEGVKDELVDELVSRLVEVLVGQIKLEVLQQQQQEGEEAK